MSNLMVHTSKGRFTTREELAGVKAPEGTYSHVPVAHIEIVNTLDKILKTNQMEIKSEQFAVSRDGMKMFGVLDLTTPLTKGTSISIGIRNSNNKQMALGVVAGYRVFVCDNMAFASDFEPIFRKHTLNISVEEVATLSLDRLMTSIEPMRAQLKALAAHDVETPQAKQIIYDAFTSTKLDLPSAMLPKVHSLYFDNEVKEFEERNLWSLSNAFTGAFKEMAPLQLFPRTALLAEFFNAQLN